MTSIMTTSSVACSLFLWRPRLKDGQGLHLSWLFQTFQSFLRILYVSIDSNEADVGPKEGYRPIVFMFYFIYIIILAFFMINIFVGFVIVTFQREGEAPYADCGLDKVGSKRVKENPFLRNPLTSLLLSLEPAQLY